MISVRPGPGLFIGVNFSATARSPAPLDSKLNHSCNGGGKNCEQAGCEPEHSHDAAFRSPLEDEMIVQWAAEQDSSLRAAIPDHLRENTQRFKDKDTSSDRQKKFQAARKGRDRKNTSDRK